MPKTGRNLRCCHRYLNASRGSIVFHGCTHVIWAAECVTAYETLEHEGKFRPGHARVEYEAFVVTLTAPTSAFVLDGHARLSLR